MWNTSSTTSLSMGDIQDAMKAAKRIQSEHEMRQAECNLDILPQKCNVCGHVPKLTGGIASGRIEVCAHQDAWMRANLPKADPVTTNPLAFGFDGSLAIDVVEPKRSTP